MNKTNNPPLHSYIPHEIWTNILARLPVKTLVRFMCVSKAWQGLIEDPKFIHMHLSLSKNNVEQSHVLTFESKIFYCDVFSLRSSDTGILLEKSTTLLEFEGYTAFLVRDDVNGILLLSNNKQLVLWNPSIRKCTLLPKFPEEYKEKLSDIICVLGYDPSSDDYKVIVTGFYDLSFQPPSDLMIYSTRTNTWKQGSTFLDTFDSPISYRFMLLAPAVFVSGVTYWMISKDSYPSCMTFSGILYFDFSNETFNMLGLPDNGNNKENMRFHFVMGGSLAIFEVSSTKSCIWVREKVDNTKTWTWNKRNVRDSNVGTYEFFKGWNYTIVVFGSYVFLEKSHKFLLVGFDRICYFDIESHQRVEHNLRVKGSFPTYYYMSIYMESLIMFQGMESDETLTRKTTLASVG